MARSAMVETPHTAGDHPPHLELIPLHDEARQVLRIGGFENVLVSSLGQPLHADFSVEGRNDDMPGQGVQLPIYHHDVAIEDRSEEHTSELQSRENLVCRLLLEKKNKLSMDT